MKQCPRCGAPYDRDVLVGISGNTFGRKFSCGTIVGPAVQDISTPPDGVTVLWAACAYFVQRAAQIDSQVEQIFRAATFNASSWYESASGVAQLTKAEQERVLQIIRL